MSSYIRQVITCLKILIKLSDEINRNKLTLKQKIHIPENKKLEIIEL